MSCSAIGRSESAILPEIAKFGVARKHFFRGPPRVTEWRPPVQPWIAPKDQRRVQFLSVPQVSMDLPMYGFLISFSFCNQLALTIGQ